MTKVKIEPARIITNFLRSTLTDINSNRGASDNWIYDDFPLVRSLGDASFPRVGITLITENSEALGMYDDNQWETLNFQIDVVTKRGLIFNHTTTDEALGTIASNSNSNRMVFDEVPNTITNIKHDGTAFGTITKKDTDDDFTTPGSLAAGTVEWSASTGNLNFSAADITSYNGQAITSTSVVVFSNTKCCQYIARDIVKQFRNNWRSNTNFKGLTYPKKISNNPQPLDEDLGIFRQTLEYQCNGINMGEGI